MADTKSNAPTPPNGASSPTLGQRIAGIFRPSASGASRKKPSPTSQFIVGSIAFVLIAEVLTYLLQIANFNLNLHLEQPIIGSQASWLSWIMIIQVLIIIGVWVILRRVGLIPANMFAPRNGTTTTTRSNTSAGKSSGGASASSANQIPGIGKARTRAERRYTATVKEAASSKNGKNGKNGASNDATQETFSTEHDEVYDRVRAAQRLRKRRSAR